MPQRNKKINAQQTEDNAVHIFRKQNVVQTTIQNLIQLPKMISLYRLLPAGYQQKSI